MRTRFGFGAVCAATMAILPGCIVGDIHDELKQANARVEQVEKELEAVNRTNELLEELRNERLQILDSIQASLVALQKRLETMDSIDESLKRIDRHLASLRETIENIDSTIPFLKIGGDKSVEEDEAEVQAEIDRQKEAEGGTEDPGSEPPAGAAPPPGDPDPKTDPPG